MLARVAFATALVLVLTACSGLSTSGTTTSSPAETSSQLTVTTEDGSGTPEALSPVGSLVILNHDLAPGRHTTTIMTPTIAFSVGEGWIYRGEYEPLLLLMRDVVAQGRSEVLNFVTFHTNSIDAVIETIKSQEILKSTDPVEVSIDGYDGLSFTADVVVPGSESVELYIFPNNRLYNQIPLNPPQFRDGTRIRFTIIPIDGDVMTIMAISGDGTDFDSFLDAADEVLATISFDETDTG